MSQKMYVQALHNLQYVMGVEGFLSSLQLHSFSKYFSGAGCVSGTGANAGAVAVTQTKGFLPSQNLHLKGEGNGTTS